MSRLTIAATALLAATAAATGGGHDGPKGPKGWKYKGCSEIDSSTFPVAVDFFAPFTVEQCLSACGSAKYVAVGAGCHCSEEELIEPEFTGVDEARCDRPCVADNKKGGICGGDGVFSVYKKKGKDHGDDDDDDDHDGDDGHDDDEDDCTEEPTGTNTADPTGPPHGTKTYTTMQTVTSCPDEVPDCPLKPTSTPTLPPCDGDEGCPPEPTDKPVPPPGASTSDSSPQPSEPPPVEASAARGTLAASAIALGLLAFAMI